MNRNKMLLIVCALLAAVVTVKAADQPLYKGKLDPKLSSGGESLLLLSKAKPETIALLPTAPKEGDQVFERLLAPEIRVALILTKTGDKTLYIDLNKSNTFEEAERFVLPVESDLEFNLPISAGIFKSIPIKLGSYAGNALYLRAAFFVMANGSVNIGGRTTLVRYGLSMKNKGVDPTRGSLYVDCNGDGKFDGFPSNVEVTPGRGKPVVFRVGTHYVVTKSVDVNTGEIVMEERPASEYTRIELQAGSIVPDFAFNDFNGKPRKLSDLLGKNKYLLLDFWGSW